MELLLQTDVRLPAIIRRWGCAMRVLQAMPEILAGRALRADQIIELYEQGLSNGSIVTNSELNCFVNDNNRVIADAAKLLCLTDFPIVNDINGHGRFIRLKHLTRTGTHFSIFDSLSTIGYDPDPSLTIIKANIGIRLFNLIS